MTLKVDIDKLGNDRHGVSLINCKITSLLAQKKIMWTF